MCNKMRVLLIRNTEKCIPHCMASIHFSASKQAKIFYIDTYGHLYKLIRKGGLSSQVVFFQCQSGARRSQGRVFIGALIK